MTSIAYSPVRIQTSELSAPLPPPWFGEVVLIVTHLLAQGVLDAIMQRVHFARRRFGRYEVIDFVAVLFGYAISGERTLEAFYQAVLPWAEPFMALFERDRLPARSTLSRFLSALTPEPVETLRSLFLADLLARSLGNQREIGGLVDRTGREHVVFDIDGTREAARQRALPQTPDRPAAQRRLTQICAPGYTGRKRGEVVRTRTVASQAHSSQWLGSFGNPGNGHYRAELRHAVAAIERYLQAHQLPQASALLRLDGQYGTRSVIASLEGFSFVTRGKDYQVLSLPEVQARLQLPIGQQFTRPESHLVRTLYDCPEVSVEPRGLSFRVVVATHPETSKKSRIGLTRQGIVYELFFTNLPQQAFTAADVVALYLHRGVFEPTLADEDQEQEPDRWCSHASAGQEAWQIVSQWVWNLRLELGHQLVPTALRTTEFAEAQAQPVGGFGYGLPVVGALWKAGRFSGQDFVPEPDGTLRCPEGKKLRLTEQRREVDGTLRLLYSARITDCRSCRQREQCQWHGATTTKPRRVSLLLRPLQVGAAPLLWQDWSRRQHRRACRQLVRHQRVEVQFGPGRLSSPPLSPPILSRAQRAHYRLTFRERLARNARVPTAGLVKIQLFGVPDAFATFLGLRTP
jgi:hypothetical protein